jgi:CAAX prenyl protease-like protein
MADQSTSPIPGEPPWLNTLVEKEPRAPLMIPYLAYLLLLMIAGAAASANQHILIVLHIVGALYVAWFFRRHLPPMGRLHLVIAIPAGLAAAWLWVAGQHWLTGQTIGKTNLGGWLPLYPGSATYFDPAREFGDNYMSSTSFWAYATLKITRAATAVPVVEELFWRGFILRAFINWNRFETVPLGKFTLFSVIASSLLSTVQHPDNWGVSIACWIFFNVLFCMTRSLWCLIITHAITNIALYIYVIKFGDWRFW